MCFLHVNFVAQDSFVWVVLPEAVDEVYEWEHCVAKDDSRKFLISDSLVDRLPLPSVEGKVVRDSLLRDDVRVLVDGELVLAAHWVDFGLLDFLQRFDGEGDAVT